MLLRTHPNAAASNGWGLMGRFAERLRVSQTAAMVLAVVCNSLSYVCPANASPADLALVTNVAKRILDGLS